MPFSVMLALVTDAFGGRGGIAQYNRDLLTAAAGSGAFQEIFVIPRHAAEREEAPAPVNQAEPPRGKLAYVLEALFRAMRLRPSAIFCGHLNLAVPAWMVARLCGARLVLQMHGIEAWEQPSRMRRAVVEAADLVLCVSRYTRARVLDWASIAPERIVVVPDTVADLFEPGEPGSLRSALGLANKRVLLTVGRLDPRERYKGHDRIIEAIPRLVAQGHDVEYLIIGDGDDRNRLSALAGSADAAERVRFLGPVSREALIEAYRAADLFVMPSTGEGFSIAFLEAMACGTPALGLAIGGACDALADGELGALADKNDDLADVIADLLSAPAPVPAVLSKQTQARFGRAAFRERVALAFARLSAPA